MRKLTYPLIEVLPHRVSRVDTASSLLCGPEWLLSDGSFMDLTIIEPNGHCSKVLSASKGRLSLNPFDLLGYPFWPKYRRYWFDLELAEPEQMNLEDVKQLLIDKIVGNNWYLARDGKPEEIQQQMMDCQTFEELFDQISYHTNFRAESRRRNRAAKG